MLRHADSLLSDGPYHEKDIDLLVRGTDVKTACRVLSETGFTRFGRSPTRYHLDYARYVEGTIVAVDIHAGAVSWNGIPYAPGNRLLERRLDDRSLPVPALADEAALLAMHCILDKRLFSAPYRARIETLLPAAGPSTVEQALLEWIGCSTANHLISALVGQHYGRAVGLRHDILLDIGINETEVLAAHSTFGPKLALQEIVTTEARPSGCHRRPPRRRKINNDRMPDRTVQVEWLEARAILHGTVA